MATDEVLMRAAAWLSLAAWAAGEWWRASEDADPERRRARVAWTIGALALLAHTALAFQVRHAWSHQHASDAIARRTEEIVGIAWAGGIWINYLFAALWMGEAAWWWARPAGFLGRPRAALWSVRLVFLTMFVNGAIVFAEGPVVAAGLLATGIVLLSWCRGVLQAEPRHA